MDPMNETRDGLTRLREARRQRGWSQAELANKLNIDPKTVSRWERGLAFPQPYYRQRLCDIYQMSAEDLGLISDKLLKERKVEIPHFPEEKFTHARIFLFILILTLILVFNNNTIFVSIITATIIIYSIKIFDPISYAVLKYCDKFINVFLGRVFLIIEPLLFKNHLQSLSPWLKHHRRLIIDIAAIIAIIMLVGNTTLRPLVATTSSNLNDSVCLKTQLPWPTCTSGFGVTTLPNGVLIGVIADNTYGPFDNSILNQDEITVEKLIFGENQRACAVQHITLVVVTMLSRTPEDPLNSSKLGLEDLQGDYLAQHDYNTAHPKVSLCLAIANLGTADTANNESPLVRSNPGDYSLPQVIHQIAQLARSDPSFRGVVGFPFSRQAKEALNLIKGYQNLSTIPIISPSASSSELSNIQNFYRTVSPDQSQGTALAQFFCNSLIQQKPSDSIAMLSDGSDPYSRSLELAFSNALNCGDPAHRMPITYSIGDASSIQKAVDLALSQHATYIFFSGYDKDLDTVELEIHQVLPERYARDITIIGGDGINNVDPVTHYSYNRVYATSFAGPLPQNSPLAESFIQLGFSKSSFAKAIPSYLWIPGEILQTYDAVKAFVQTVQNITIGGITQNNFNNTLATISFNGMSGEVTFRGTSNNQHRSDRDQGYVYITCMDYIHNIHLRTEYSTINNGDKTSVQNLPLGQADGASICPS